jgi:hypothetical protein
MTLDLSVGPPPPRCESCRALLPYHNEGCANPTREWIICDDILDDDHAALTPERLAAAMKWYDELILSRIRKE